MNLTATILTDTQKSVLTQIASIVTTKGFYLAGGTALGIYFAHRDSVDFDFFINKNMGDPLELAKYLTDSQILFQTNQIDKGTLHGYIDNVRVTFLQYHYPLLQPTQMWKEFGCHLASLDDLICMKLSAIAQRGARKDFLDIFTLCSQHKPLSELLENYQRKFSIDDIGHVIYSLTYFQDAEGEPMPPVHAGQDWDIIKQTIQGWVKDLSDQAVQEERTHS